MNSAAIAVLALVLSAAVVAPVAAQTGTGVCHFDCYGPTDPAAGANAKQTLLNLCGVTSSKVVTTGLSAAYGKAAPAGCTVAACGYYANAAALATYRNSCEHPNALYINNLQGKGLDKYDVACNSC